MKKIIHIDMDAFYASVEQLHNPSLQGKPIVVGGTPRGRGVVATASYEARRFGIKSAMPSHKALKLCPQVIFVKPNFKLYKETSQKIRAIFHEVTELVEPLSLDEAYLDVTENKLGELSATKVALWIKNRIKEETGLSSTAGVSSVKFVAKIASNMKKPNGLTVVPPNRIIDFISELPVDFLWGVGPATKKKLGDLGIFYVRDLQFKTENDLYERMGSFSTTLINFSKGIDPRPVSSHSTPKSRGAEQTFPHDLYQFEELSAKLKSLSEKIATALKKIPTKGRTITVKIKYTHFKILNRSYTANFYTDDAKIIYQLALNLLKKLTIDEKNPIRLLGASVSNFYGEDFDSQQLELPFDWDYNSLGKYK